MEAWARNRNETSHEDAAAAAFDPFYMEFKAVSGLPAWLKLQHEIRADLDKLMAETARSRPADFAAGLTAINRRIAEYNRHVPSSYLRKSALTPDNWTEQYESWQ